MNLRHADLSTRNLQQVSHDGQSGRAWHLAEVRSLTGLSTATIYRKMETGQFPPKVRLSVNIVAWYESDVGRWVADPLGWRATA